MHILGVYLVHSIGTREHQSAVAKVCVLILCYYFVFYACMHTLQCSTLALSIIRIVETFQGSIKLRGRDVNSIPLQQLRSEVSSNIMLINTFTVMYSSVLTTFAQACCCYRCQRCLSILLYVR
jgi:hypothetical protein